MNLGSPVRISLVQLTLYERSKINQLICGGGGALAEHQREDLVGIVLSSSELCGITQNVAGDISMQINRQAFSGAPVRDGVAGGVHKFA